MPVFYACEILARKVLSFGSPIQIWNAMVSALLRSQIEPFSVKKSFKRQMHRITSLLDWRRRKISTFFLGRDEKVVREQSDVYYHCGMSRFGSPMYGKLILTNKRFVFAQQHKVQQGGFIGFGKTAEIHTTAMPINIPLDKIIGCQIETRTRKKGTMSQPASVFSKEQYQIIIVGLETPEGMESPTFEVSNPQDWETALRRSIGGETL